jgi:hypothetical protein
MSSLPLQQARLLLQHSDVHLVGNAMIRLPLQLLAAAAMVRLTAALAAAFAAASDVHFVGHAVIRLALII